MTEIRPATESDRFPLFKLAVAMHEETDFKSLDFDPQRALHNLGAWMHDDRNLMLVAERDGEIVGMMAANTNMPWFSSDLIASEDLLFVREDCRGSPIGYRLMRAFMGWARTMKVKHIRAGFSTGKPGKSAGRLYEVMGFHKVGDSYSLFPNFTETAP
jgi:GNAT superfamily N-acetyltransferase